MNALTIKLLTGAVIATISIGGLAYTGKIDLDLTKANADTLKSKVMTLQGDVNNLDTLIKAKNDLLLKFDTNLTASKGDKAILQAEIASLTLDRDSLSTQLLALQQELASSTADQSTIDALQAEITRLEGEITKANQEAASLKAHMDALMAEVGTKGDTAVDTTQYNVTLNNDVSSTPTTTPAPTPTPTPSPTPSPTTYVTATQPNITNPDMYAPLSVTQSFTPENIKALETEMRTATGQDITLVEVIVNGVGSTPTVEYVYSGGTMDSNQLTSKINTLVNNAGTMHNTVMTTLRSTMGVEESYLGVKR